MLNIVDANVPQSCVFPRPSRPAPQARVVGPIEQGWINYQPYFDAPVAQHELPTTGTMKPLNPLERFATKVAEWQAIEATQKANLELETVAQELARIGISSSSLNRKIDDDEHGPTLEDAIGPKDPVPFEYPDDALVRRIEWERYALSCGPVTHVYWTEETKNVAEPGEPPKWVGTGNLIFTTDQPKSVLPKESIPARFGAALLRVLDGRTLDDLRNDWERVRYYGGKIGSLLYGVRTGEHEPIQSILDTMIAEDEDEASDGPRELGFHDEDHPNEPGETFLWPVTKEEVQRTLALRLPLDPTEQNWLNSHPEEAQQLGF